MLVIPDEYFIGFTEGEGCFYTGIVSSKETRNGWQVVHFFKVSQNPSGKVILDAFKKRLGCGYVKPNDKNILSSDKSLAYVVRNITDLKEKVIPFFKNKLVIKRREFEIFSTVVERISRKEHLSKQGFKELIDLIYTDCNNKRKFSKEEILKKILTDYTPES